MRVSALVEVCGDDGEFVLGQEMLGEVLHANPSMALAEDHGTMTLVPVVVREEVAELLERIPEIERRLIIGLERHVPEMPKSAFDLCREDLHDCFRFTHRVCRIRTSAEHHEFDRVIRRLAVLEDPFCDEFRIALKVPVGLRVSRNAVGKNQTDHGDASLVREECNTNARIFRVGRFGVELRGVSSLLAGVFGEVLLADANVLWGDFHVFVAVDVFQGTFQVHVDWWNNNDDVVGT